MDGTETSCRPPALTPTACVPPPTISVPPPDGTLVTTADPTQTHIIAQSPWLTLRFALGVVHSVGVNKCVGTRIYHYGIIQNNFTALKPLCSAYSSLPTQPLETNDLFTLSIILLFPEWHIVRIKPYVAFSDWLPSLSDTHLSFFHVFHGWMAHFILSLTSILLSGCTTGYLSFHPQKTNLVAFKFGLSW